MGLTGLTEMAISKPRDLVDFVKFWFSLRSLCLCALCVSVVSGLLWRTRDKKSYENRF